MEPIQPYVDYCNFSEMAQQYGDRYQKRKWVPNWLWNLVSVRLMNTEEISKELIYAATKLFLQQEAEIMSHGQLDFGDITKMGK